MRHILFSIALTLITSLLGIEVSAQNIDRMRNNLAVRTMDGTYVSVEEDASAKAAISAVEGRAKAKSVNGYRIVIFSDNGQYAGDNAKRVHTTFQKTFPHINAYLVYESPYFKVSVGDCLTMEEAQILMAKLSAYYPKAFPKREDINLSDLQRVVAEEDIPRDSITHK